MDSTSAPVEEEKGRAATPGGRRPARRRVPRGAQYGDAPQKIRDRDSIAVPTAATASRDRTDHIFYYFLRAGFHVRWDSQQQRKKRRDIERASRERSRRAEPLTEPAGRPGGGGQPVRTKKEPGSGRPGKPRQRRPGFWRRRRRFRARRRVPASWVTAPGRGQGLPFVCAQRHSAGRGAIEPRRRARLPLRTRRRLTEMP